MVRVWTTEFHQQMINRTDLLLDCHRHKMTAIVA